MGLDIDLGIFQASRWGNVLNVPVAGLFAPFVGVNLFYNPSNNDALNLEATGAVNMGLGGRQDVADPGFIPTSGTLTVGFGWQHTLENSDWGFGLELYGKGENALNNIGAPGNLPSISGGLRFDFGAINPRRNGN